MATPPDERARSVSLYDYSDPSIRHAWIALVALAALRGIGAVAGMVVQPPLIIWYAIDFLFGCLLLGALAFGVHKESRVAVVLAIILIVANQLYIWFGIGSLAGTLPAVIVTGFLLRGAVRIFEHHRDSREAPSQAAAN